MDDFIYGFDIISLYNLVIKAEGIVKIPYNRNNIPRQVIQNMKRLIQVSKMLKIHIDTMIQDVSSELSIQKNLELRILTLFQNINSLGNYSDPNWFLSLNRNQILKLIRELVDIWNYRAQLSIEMKVNICPPHGNPFLHLNMHYLQTEPDLLNVKKIVIEVFEKIVNNNADKDSKALGAYYVLGAITLVNNTAASSLPWLFQSFASF